MGTLKMYFGKPADAHSRTKFRYAMIVCVCACAVLTHEQEGRREILAIISCSIGRVEEDAA